MKSRGSNRAQLLQRMGSVLRSRVTIVVWVAAAGLAATMFVSRTRSHEFIGLASVLQYKVSAPIGGKIDSVLVRELEPVNAGEMVGQMDSEMLQARFQTAMATAHQLRAELAAERARLTIGQGPLAEGYATVLRRFRMDEQDRGLNALSLRVQIESDQVEEERLRLEEERAETLFTTGLISQNDVDLARLARRQVIERLKHNRILLAQIEDEQREAAQRRQDLESERPAGEWVEPALLPLEEAVNVQMALIEELRVEQASLILRAPVSGEVSQILCRKGQVVVPGEPVLVIAERISSEILAYLPEAAAGRLRERSIVVVAPRSDPGRMAESIVTRVGASIEMTPPQLWRDPRIPEYGLAVAIAGVPGLRLTPGEVVLVRTGRSG